jgi:hypothetical protein
VIKPITKNILKEVRKYLISIPRNMLRIFGENTIQEFLKNGMPTSTTYTTQKAGSLGEALKNLKNNAKNTKAGTKISNLLKTKKGKVGAGIGGGLLLAQLLRNNNSTPDEMSEEELNELYNYVYGGQ